MKGKFFSISTNIDAKLEAINENLLLIISLLERITADQAQLLSIIASQNIPPYPIPPTIYPTSTLHMPPWYPTKKIIDVF